MSPHHDATAWTLTLTAGEDVYTLGADALLEPPRWEASLAEDHRPPRRSFALAGTARLRREAARDSVLLAAIHPDAPPVTWALHDGAAIWRARGFVTAVRVSGAATELALRLATPGADTPVCRRVPLDDARPSDWLPRVFGRCVYKAAPLFRAPSSLLAADVTPDDDTIPLRGPVQWPAPGTVQLAEETISYLAINGGGTLLEGLVRPAPRHHRRGTRVVRRPANPRWVLADQSALAVHRLAAGAIDGPMVTGGTIATTVVAGRDAVTLSLAALPLDIRHDHAPTLLQTPLQTTDWTLRPETTAAEPLEALREAAPFNGSRLTADTAVLSAQWTRGFELSPDRHDLVVGLELSFEFTETPHWAPDTRLVVRAEHGDHHVTLSIDRSGAAQELGSTGSATLPPAADPGPATEPHHPALVLLAESGGWTQPAQAIDGRADTEAAVESPGEAALQFAAALPVAHPARPATALALHVRLRNRAGNRVGWRLEFTAPDTTVTMTEGDTAALTSEEISLVLPIEPPVALGALLAAGHAAALVLPDGGDVAVETIWLAAELVRERDPAPTAPPDPLALEVKALAPVPWHRVSINLDASLAGGMMLGAVGTPAARLGMRIELVAPPAISLWGVSVRDVHWRLMRRAASTPSPSAELWVDASGPATRPDGTVGPVDAVAQLLEDVLLEGAAEAAAATDALDIGVGAVLAGPQALDAGVESLLGESLLFLRPAAAGWWIGAVPAPDLNAAGELLGAEVHRPLPAIEEALLRSSPTTPLVLWRADEDRTFPLTAPPPGGLVALQWLRTGAPALAAWIEWHRRHGARYGWIGVDATRGELPGGAWSVPGGSAGMLVSVRWERGRLQWCLAGPVSTSH